MTSEANVQRSIWAGLSRAFRASLYRTNSGKAWLSGGGRVNVDQQGTAHVPYARPVGLGLALLNGDTVEGLSDLTGYVSVVITPEMVGRKVAVFCAVETKESGGGRRKKNQREYLEGIRAAGGIAGFASSVAEALEIFKAWMTGGQQPLL